MAIFLVVILFVLIIFGFLYHLALEEAWRDHGVVGVINMAFAIFIHLVARIFTE